MSMSLSIGPRLAMRMVGRTLVEPNEWRPKQDEQPKKKQSFRIGRLQLAVGGAAAIGAGGAYLFLAPVDPHDAQGRQRVTPSFHVVLLWAIQAVESQVCSYQCGRHVSEMNTNCT